MSAPLRAMPKAGMVSALVVALLPSQADAEPASIEIESHVPEAAPPPVWTPRYEGDLTWARMVLEDDRLLQRYMSDSKPDSTALLDLERDPFAFRARALTSLASAIGPIVNKGFSVINVIRNGKVRQRHALRAHWRSRGLKVVWRIDF